MSPPRTPPSATDGRRISLGQAGPYAATLLVRERPVLLEWDAGSGARTRWSGRLLAGTRAGGTLFVEPDDPAADVLPAPGTPVTLLVPTSNALWRFTTAVHAETGEGNVALAWPAEAAQETGRRFARARRMLAVRLSVGAGIGAGAPGDPGARGLAAICTYTLDISVGGAQVAVPRPLAVGTLLRLEIRLPGETITPEASVAWTRVIHGEPGDPMYGVGVRFTSIPPRDGARLRTMLGVIGLA